MVKSITLQNVADTDVVNNDILGQICFAAPNEGTGTDANLIAASIFARSEGDFAADNNATELVFVTGTTESASPGATNYDMTLSSAGNLTLAGTITCATSLTIGSAAMSEADLEFLDGITAGTAAASKAVVLNGSKNIATIGTIGCGAITSTGNSGFAQVTTSGRVIVDDATDATSTTDGSLQTDGGLSVAKDCIFGNDVKLLTDSSVLSLGVGSDATFTHDGTTGLTIAANPITLDSGAAINIEPASGSVILLDGTISIDAGVVTGATSITSTAFVGALTGNVTGNASGTALTVTQAAQSAITSVGTLTTLTVDSIIINGTTIGHTSDTDAISIASTGAVTFSQATKPGLKADTDGSTVTFNLNEPNMHTVTLGGNRTFAISNETAGQRFIIRVLQDGTGSRLVSTWFSTIKWAGGSAPTLTTTANKADVFGFVVTGTDTYDGFIVGQNV